VSSISFSIFFIMVEGLSRLISKAKKLGLLKGIKVSPEVFLTHFLFVEDIMIFGVGNLKEFLQLKSILDLFFTATSMQINRSKSSMMICTIKEDLLNQLA
jgi:hypothetical protein